MIIARILIPVTDNAELPVPQERWDAWEQAIFADGLGFQQEPLETRGGWRSEEHGDQIEWSRGYQIGLDSVRQVPVILGLVDRAARDFGQEAIWLELDAIAEPVVSPPGP